MSTTLKKQYDEKIAPALMKQFNYSTPMQIPRLVKIVLNEGLGDATQDKKIIENAARPIPPAEEGNSPRRGRFWPRPFLLLTFQK